MDLFSDPIKAAATRGPGRNTNIQSKALTHTRAVGPHIGGNRRAPPPSGSTIQDPNTTGNRRIQYVAGCALDFKENVGAPPHARCFLP